MTEFPNPQIESIRALASGKSVKDSPELREALDFRGITFVLLDGHVVLERSLELLDESTLRSALRRNSNIEVLWGVGSTNTRLMAAGGFDVPHVCVAEQQMAGKGRRGRTWVSPFGRNIYFSYGFMFPGSMVALSGLSLAVGIELTQALRDAGVGSASLKWPNDVLTPDGKLCGILVELGAATRSGIPVVIGIGVNVLKGDSSSAQIDQAWTTVASYCQIGRNELLASIASRIESMVVRFVQSGLEPYRNRWPEYCVHLEQEILILRGEETIRGVDRGIDGKGNLRLETSEGIQFVEAGEVSLRTRP